MGGGNSRGGVPQRYFLMDPNKISILPSSVLGEFEGMKKVSKTAGQFNQYISRNIMRGECVDMRYFTYCFGGSMGGDGTHQGLCPMLVQRMNFSFVSGSEITTSGRKS